jgi:hypothetical protein
MSKNNPQRGLPDAASKSALGSQVPHATELLTGSIFPATAVVGAYLKTSEDPLDIMKALNARTQAIHDGDLDEVQSMLMSQAIALQAMFTDLACRAARQDSFSNTQILTQLALKAQAGSRATLQALADLKKPRQIAFVQQANVAHNQQINNGLLQPGQTFTPEPAPIKVFAEKQVGNGC